jgi:hypothetical protein
MIGVHCLHPAQWSLTATVTATRAANANLAQPRTARPCSAIELGWASAPPEKRKVGSSILPLTTRLHSF